MNYKGIKVLEINPVVYLGEEYEDNDCEENQDIFKKKIKNLTFGNKFKIHCPIEDFIYIYIDYNNDDFIPLAKQDTIDKIFSVVNELVKVFKDEVYINLYLEGYMENGNNAVDLTITEFVEWLREELDEYNNTKSII